MNPAYIFIQTGFIALSVIYFGFFLKEFKMGLSLSGFTSERQKKIFSRILFSLIGWSLFVSVWSASGKMSDFSIFPLNVAPVIAVPLIAIIAFSFSKTTKEILVNIPPQNVIRLQSFRFFVEILLWMLFVQNLMPVQMSFEGQNFDVLSGISAPVIAFLISRQKISKTGLIIWNILGLLLLINIVAIAVLSMPTPFRVFMNEPVNIIVTQFSVSWLPGLLVPLAYGLHFLSLRQLFNKK